MKELKEKRKGEIMEKIYDEERKYLKYVYECIEKELQKTEKSLKETLRGKVSFDDGKRGEQFTKALLINLYDQRLKKLRQIVNSPYFGRIDFKPNGSNNNEIYYVGKTNILDEQGKTVIIDWRSPAASMYYDGFIGDASYTAPKGIIEGYISLKRQIMIEDAILKKVMDVDFATNDQILQDYLDIHAGNKMKTIIASIQKEQNEIIRKPISSNIIVQGVAGSGKTSVALHRVAYLTYNNQADISSKDFLIIGPNNCFLSYISGLLPELETSAVNQLTYLELVNKCLNGKFQLENNGLVGAKKSKFEKFQAFKTSIIFKELINSFVSDYIENKMVNEGIVIDGEEIYSKEFIKKILLDGNGRNPNFKRAEKYILNIFDDEVKDIYYRLNEKYRAIYINLPKDSIERKKAIEESEKLWNTLFYDGKKYIKQYFKSKKINILDIYLSFIKNIDNYYKDSFNFELEEFKTNNLKSLKKNKVTFEDLPALLYINFLINGTSENYNHIIIDEAQDFGLFHFYVLKKIFSKATFSIYGDLAQSICSYSSIDNWDDVSKLLFNNNCEILNLSKSYRTTMEITTIANKVLKQMNLLSAHPVIRHGSDVKFSNNSNNIEYKLNKIYEWLNKKYKTIAIICRDEKEAIKVYKEFLSYDIDITYISNKDDEYKGKIFVLCCDLCKGLEFDAVIINDASSKKYLVDSRLDMNLLYVATTRALHELEILYDRDICSIFSDNINNIEKIKVKK